MILSDVAIRNRVTIGVLIALIAVSGVWSYVTLPREAAPDVKVPRIIVTTTYEGVSPADVESSVTNKIEKKLSGLKGVKEIRSASAEGVSLIDIEFHPEVNVDDAMQYVRDKVELARKDLPTEAEDPVLTEINIAELPIMVVNITGDVSPVVLKEIADDLEDAIEARVPEVLNVEVLGALEREVRLEMDGDRVASYGLSIPELLKLIPSENVNISAGGLETPGTKFNVRVPAEFGQPEDIDHLILTTRNGRPIYLSDVASVRDTFKDRLTYSRLNRAESVTLSIQKRIGANIMAIVRKVNAILDEARKAAPGVRFDVTLDQSDDIRSMVSDLENNVLSGFVLVVLVLLVFMDLRSAIIVAAAVPLSMLMSLFVIQALGYTLNMVVLFSLILAVGMLVDNAIVIVENIYRHMGLGYDRIEAARKGTSEVAWPVISSTATTVAAFVPLMFWPGIMGSFMKYLPIVVNISLLSSLFVAMIISPTLASALLKGPRRAAGLVTAGPPSPKSASSPGTAAGRALAGRQAGGAPPGQHAFLRGYRAMLQTAMNHRPAVLALTVLLLAGLGIAYGKWGSGMEFFPESDPRFGIINIRCPQGTNIEESDRLARLIEERLEPYLKDSKEVKYLVTSVGSAGGGGPLDVQTGGSHMADLTLVFQDFEDRGRPSADALKEIRAALQDIPGAEIKVEKARHGPPVGSAVTVRIIGEDFRVLEDISEQARQAIADVPGLVNLRSDWTATRPELAFRVDRRRATLLGVNPQVVGSFLKTSLFGSKVGTYRQFADEYDITLRLPLEDRVQVDDLLRLQVPTLAGAAVPLSSLGEFTYTGGLGTVRHVSQKPVITLTGDAEGRQGNEVLGDIQARLAGLRPPAGVEIRYAGEREEQEKAQAFLGRAFVIAVLLIVLILVVQFNTLSVPLIIMTTVILSLIGVLGGLMVCRLPFGVVMTGVGVISLAGVVVNNAIVLLDYTRQLQRRGLDVVAATVEAGATRLRPVFLTAITTILGLVPMATGVSFDFLKMQMVWKSESSQWWNTMAIAVIFGLAFATVLTLVVVPSLYVTLYKLASRFSLGGLRRVGEQPAQPAQPRPEMEDF